MFNRVILIGRLGGDPESSTFPNGDMIVNTRIVTTEQWKNKETGEKASRDEWHRVTFAYSLAAPAIELLRKGTLVHIEGSIKTRSSKSGGKYTSIEAKCMNVLTQPWRAENGGEEAQERKISFKRLENIPF